MYLKKKKQPPHTLDVLEHRNRMVSGEHGHSLFGGVRQLILSPAIIGLLDPRVSPQHLYCVDVGLVERAHLLHIHLPHQESIGLCRDRKYW